MENKLYAVVNKTNGHTQLVETVSALQALKIAVALPYEVHAVDAVEARSLMREGVDVVTDYGLKPDGDMPQFYLSGAYIGPAEPLGMTLNRE